ncbi:MAG: haloalkane dehalogenase [Candidatus Dormibacteraeota bacterium]|nr:haloalkane dehalogenase [Candidatus Dormibacteraeota bacterium]
MTTVDVLDSAMSYVEAGRPGAGPALVFLHGNPTSSHLWRRVLPEIGLRARMLAPDLIGMGESGKPRLAYTFDDHARYLAGWFDALDLRDVVLVGHDWGGALAFDWASRHPERVSGLAFMETIVKPMAGAEFPDAARPFFASMRTPGVGEELILDRNQQMEQMLARPTGNVTDEDRETYRRPYPTRESRRPLLQWPRSMPIDGEPADVVARIESYDAWLATSPDVPKLLLAFDAAGPGILVGPRLVDWCAGHVAGLEIEQCGYSSHVAPEDQPAAIAEAITAWAGRHRLGARAVRNPA